MASDGVPLTISYKGVTFHHTFSDGSTIEDLRNHIANEFHPPLPPSSQRLILRGKQLPIAGQDGSTTLRALELSPTSKIMLVASKVDDINAIEYAKETEKQTRRKQRERDIINDLDLRSNDSNVHQGPPRNWKGHEFGFMKIEILPEQEQQSEARRIMEELAADPGVLAVCRKHKWKIGSLKEMYPKGSVGISDVCLMGLNVNKGQEILLRIRTDDLSGFRKTLTIKKVLYHELAHNVHGDHNAEFYQFMSEVEKDATKFGTGRTLGGAPRAQRQRKNHAWEGSGILGHPSPNEGCADELVDKGMDHLEEAVHDDLAPCPCCGFRRHDSTILCRPSTEQLPPPPVSDVSSMTTNEKFTNEENLQLSEPLIEDMGTLRNQLSDFGFDPQAISSALLHVGSLNSGTEEEKLDLAVEFILIHDHATPNIDSESITNERQDKIISFAAVLVRQPQGAAETADTLIGMLSQIMEDPNNMKWRQVKLTNKRFHRTIFQYPHAMSLLDAVGFNFHKEDNCLRLDRIDPALVYLGICAVQKWRSVLT